MCEEMYLFRHQLKFDNMSSIRLRFVEPEK
jgi:hypothetical protein